MKSVSHLHGMQRILAILFLVAIISALFLAPFITASANSPVDDFVIPVPIMNPQTPDEEFFNMRLEFFLPETEPLIKETFGAVLRFEQEAFWEYESYYSRAVSFATNLPTLAKIEYGLTTDYGLSTAQTESYYYQHLMHLTGLEPGNTYHYRIKVKGSDGAFLASEDYTFTTPLVPADVIRVPEDLADKSLPYKLTTANAKYLLTQDVNAPNGGIVLKAHNIELDMGGHTITYDMEPNPTVYESLNNGASYNYDEGASMGVRCGMWNFRNQKVFNGSIVQGANGGTGCNGSGYNPILFTHIVDIEIGGVAVDYYGDSVNGICGDFNNYIHHNVVYDRGSVIDNRHSQMRAITCGGGENEASYNSVRRCRQTGIAVDGPKNGNEIYGDSFAPNSFLLGYNSNVTSAGNKIFGLGYNPIGIGSGGSKNAVARDNFIYLHAYAPSQRNFEYNRISGVAGFRPQIYDVGDYDNNLFENNVIVCKAWHDSSYIRAIWAGSDVDQNNMRIINNVVKVEAMADNLSGDCFTCVDLQGDAAAINVPEVLYADNRFITNMTFLTIGTGYGIGSNASFYRNSFEKIDHHISNYTPYRMGYWYWNSINNKIIDSIAGPGVDLSAPVKNISYNTEPHLTLAIGISSQRAYTDAATGAPLANTVIAWRLDGGDQGSFTTDENGEAYREWITTMNEHKPGDPSLIIFQVHNLEVIFTVDGYKPVKIDIEDLQGEGPAILFRPDDGTTDPIDPPGPPVDDFVIPEPLANPQTADEEFYNMRLEFFLPETEPLIKETFGPALRFEQDAFWEYESNYSRAISFATNLPTLAMIEYGPTTAYGFSTEQTEFYYYQHLIHLTGLSPGNTYHYRIKIKGSDGSFRASDNYTFTTPRVSRNIFRVPDDLADKSLPYKLTIPNTKYVLTQDINAPNGGIILKASNIELDLGGHTITYDMSPNPTVYADLNNGASYAYDEEATYGIRGGLWNFRNQKIFNGRIVQGLNGGNGFNGTGYNPLFFTQITGIEIGGLTIEYHGDGVNGINGDGDSIIHHNVIYDRGAAFTQPNYGTTAIMAYLNTNNVMSYNSVRRCRLNGIISALQCYGNEVYGDSFALHPSLLAQRTGSRVYGNKVFGLGYSCVGINSNEASNAVAEDNFIYLHAYSPVKRHNIHDWDSSVVGLSSYIYNDASPRQENNLFANNVVVAKAWQPNTWVRGIQAVGSPQIDNQQFNNNIVKVEVMSNTVDLTKQRHPITCVNINGSTAPSPDTIFSDNLLLTNATFVCFGYGDRGRDTAFYRTTFEKIGHHDSNFWTFRMHDGRANDLINHKFIDSVAGPGVDLTLPPLNLNTWQDARYNLAVGISSQRVYADAATGAPLANAVIAWQLNGGGQGSFTTDENGEAYREWITTWNERKSGDPFATMLQVHNSVITFTAAGYEPLTMNIADLQGRGAAILFGSTGDPPPLYDPNIKIEEGLRGGPGLDANTINLNFWTRCEFDGAEIYRSESPDGSFQLVKTENGKPTYYDTGLKPNTTYYYKLRLFQGNHFGPLCDVYAFTTKDVTIEDGLRGGAGLDANTININFWGRTEFDGAEIYRSESPDGPFLLVKTENGKPTYFDTGLKPNTTYYYQLRLFQGTHFGPLCDVYAFTTKDVTIEDGLRGGAGLDANTINISFWGRSEFDGAEIYRSESPGGPFLLVKTENGKPTYFDTGLKPNTTYYYKLRLFQGNHFGPLCDVYAFSTKDVTIEDGLRGGAGLDANTININFWGRTEFDGAEIYRSESPDGPFLLVKTENGKPTYFDTGLKPNTTYYYKLRLFQGNHFGPLCDAAAFKTNDVLAEDFRGRANSNSIELSWWSRSVWNYAEVYRSDTPNGNFAHIGNTNTAPFFDYSIVSGKTYYYKIRLIQNSHSGAFTDAIAFTAQ